jgi:hypothetical protein
MYLVLCFTPQLIYDLERMCSLDDLIRVSRYNENHELDNLAIITWNREHRELKTCSFVSEL